ncbi:seryl-tRNA synthetase [candidate division MSBL1 archaeon SCGC-AAA259I09]|uniref:Serine--tRNA ligase n=5 Tax=candidate division MSBL1 TaxID=215777 RepID=A0A133UV55_9EURY|nr:seryl-tRNA synthetase [candidate division MSBL1 archaeon SCGC-AAA259B11]KXA90592.1 seryl-tRNA synthetase [candidate division MSBL1 archaeon SCGC-AAA259D14]KXA96555.1 seryl-tRNA synthetase [candidate division MSBL1 archaeon SCGC-AAA259J03]KXA98091.1 seryl-tRNA synthetase [candidate division MSBL1 archaeon SCGC-AAA259I09]
MLDIELVREDPDRIKDDLRKRNAEEMLGQIESLRKKDEKWRSLKHEMDQLKHQKNVLSQKIGEKKSNGEDAEEEIQKSKDLSQEIEDLNKEKERLREEIDATLMNLPNLLHPSVPRGEDEEDNVELYRVGDPKVPDYPLYPHGEVMENLDMGDFDRASKVSGHGFFYLKKDLVQLDLALINYSLDKMIEKGYEPIEPPFLMRRDPYEGTVDLSDFEDVMYKLEGEDLYLIATSEHPIAAMYQDEILNEDDLPKKFVGVSPCFRKEIGSHGIDTKGLFRVHQFNKVEQFVFSKPENSWDYHEELLQNAEELLKELEIPYRVVNVCTGDIGSIAAKKYDLETWSPRQEKYVEVVSCSNCTDYQARRLNIRMGKVGAGEKEFVHTLNSTALATSRTIVAILENNQLEDGSVKIPEPLWDYMNGKKVLASEK